MKIKMIGWGGFAKWFQVWTAALEIAGHTRVGAFADAEVVFLINPFAFVPRDTQSYWDVALGEEKQLMALQSWAKGNGIDPALHDDYTKRRLLSSGIVGLDPLAPRTHQPFSTVGIPSPWTKEGIFPSLEMRRQLCTLIDEAGCK